MALHPAHHPDNPLDSCLGDCAPCALCFIPDSQFFSATLRRCQLVGKKQLRVTERAVKSLVHSANEPESSRLRPELASKPVKYGGRPLSMNSGLEQADHAFDRLLCNRLLHEMNPQPGRRLSHRLLHIRGTKCHPDIRMAYPNSASNV